MTINTNDQKKIKGVIFLLLMIVLMGAIYTCSSPIPYTEADHEKISFGKHMLLSSLQEIAIDTHSVKIQLRVDQALLPESFRLSESYSIRVDSIIEIIGADAAGVMYGCVELAERIRINQKIPFDLYVCEKPMMKLRGVCILLMKLGTYNYPITPEHFPFFYDKSLWIDYLDFLAAQKYNYITIWNGHPFAYFVKLDRYPEAQDGLDPSVLKLNHEMLKWLIKESAKRNIRLYWEFYNIHTSVYYQKAHRLPDEISTPTKELAAYTSYVIEKFIKAFPEVGLYITAGEALDKSHSVFWVRDVILAAVKRAGKTIPVILRSWYLDLDAAKEIVKEHPSIFIESKYNVEMVADTLIDPMNREWAALTNHFIVNIHMAGNLEPFRWNPPFYIQKCLQSSYRIGTNGFHLYPRKSWRWPSTNEIGCDLFQWQRDEWWFTMWGRYAWNCSRDPVQEKEYWINRFSNKYGSQETAHSLLESFEAVADVLPAIQRLFWAGHDNHTVVTAGLMLKQIERAPGIPFLLMDDVRRIPVFLEDVKNMRDVSEQSPIDFLIEKQKSCHSAIEKMKQAMHHCRKNQRELQRYFVDLQATQWTIDFYLQKLQAAYYYHLPVENSHHNFIRKLKASLDSYKRLTELTDPYYDSISDVPASHPLHLEKTPYHWRDLLPYYEKEYQIFYEDFESSDKKENNLPIHQGLVAIVFGDPHLVRPRKILRIKDLEMNWHTYPPDDGRNWSVLCMGFIRSPISGRVVFTASSEQEVIVTINGHRIIEKPAKDFSASSGIEMTKDQWYPIAIEYNNIDFKGSNLSINWTLPGKRPSKIDDTCLSHSQKDAWRAEHALILGF